MSDFFQDKKTVYENIDDLQDRIDTCVSIGMKDYDDVLYNETVVLMDEIEEIRNYAELSEIILKGMNIEKTLDSWLSNKGQNSLSMSWPKIPSEEL